MMNFSARFLMLPLTESGSVAWRAGSVPATAAQSSGPIPFAWRNTRSAGGPSQARQLSGIPEGGLALDLRAKLLLIVVEKAETHLQLR